MTLTKRTYRSVEIASLSVAAISTFIIAGETSDWQSVLNEWNLWILSPYIFFFIISVTANHQSGSVNVASASCYTAILISAFTLFIYIDAFYIHVSSTSALVFLFIPLYLIIGGPVVFFIIYMIVVRRQKKGKG